MTVKNLRHVSVIYLLLPNLIFFYSWTRLPIAIIGITILIYLFSDDYKDPSFKSEVTFGTKDLFIVGFTGLMLTVISGTAGICFQTPDYWCHNAKYNELFRHAWPIRIPSDGPVTSYYYGYYVIPALFFKITGSLNETFIVVWTTIGIAIGIAWAYLVLNKKIWFVLAALCTGDFPHLVKSILTYFSIHLYKFSDFGIENWSLFENIFWVPNQIIPSLIIAGMLAYILKNNLNTYLIILPVILIFWWAIFPAFTLTLFIGIMILKEWGTAFEIPHYNTLTRKYFLPALILIPIVIYFLSHETTPVSGFIWTFRKDNFNLFSEYSINILINVIAFLIIFFSLKRTGFSILDFFPILIILILTTVFPIYRLGKVNDFLFRGMIPLLAFTGIYLYYPLTVLPWKATFQILRSSVFGWLVLLIIISTSAIAIGRVWRAITENRFAPKQAGTSFIEIPYDAYPNVYEVLKKKWSQQEANQYLGKVGSLYENYIAP